MKKLFILGACLLTAAFMVPAIASQPTVPADGLVLQKTSKHVVFNHSTHASVECGACHHPVDGKEDYRACATAGCHDILDRKDKTVHSYYQAMHKMKGGVHQSCVACHIATAGSDAAKKKELAGCAKSKCHP